MKKLLFTCLVAAAFIGCSTTNNNAKMDKLIDHVMAVSQKQAIGMAEVLKDSVGMLPRTIDKEGRLVPSDAGWWCSGFFPGVLWYTYEYTGNDTLLQYARQYTARVENQKYTTDNHDVGFMLYCSFGNGLRITGEESYKDVLATGARSLATRYRPHVGLIRSWDHKRERWQYPVIIDNMMNLELLLWAADYTDNDMLRQIALNHADRTIENHFRSDYSTYHVVSYDTITAQVEKRETFQGYADSSAWARGEAWALYGYTMMHRMTGEQRYLEQAKHIANFILHHPRLPKDKIPYWDFDAPAESNNSSVRGNSSTESEPLRDASAGAIICSALIDLSTFVDDTLRNTYLDVARTQLCTLASSKYLAEPGTNAHFILKHSVGSKPQNSEVDVPLTYADYYFLEALMRYKKIVLAK